MKTFVLLSCVAFLSMPFASVAGTFTAETCKNSEGLAKRVFLTKKEGMSYERYRKIEGPTGEHDAGKMVEAIEKGIFQNSKIDSIDKAAQFAYSTCITWK